MNTADTETHISCPICQARLRKSDDLFCPFHRAALESIRQRYIDWVDAYGSLSKKRYLELLAANSNSGEWVVEVAKYLLGKGETEVV